MSSYSDEVLEKLRALKPRFKEMNIKRLRVFGSVVRGEADKNSDVDLIVDFYEVPGLFDFVGMQNSLAEKLGAKVDLMTELSLHPALKNNIMQEAQDV